MDSKKSKLMRVLSSRRFWLSFLFLILATLLNFASSEFIQRHFPGRLPVIDTIFNIAPEVMWTQYLTDISVIASVVILLYFTIKNDLEHLPYYIFVFALAYAFRGVIIVFNPMGVIYGNIHHYGISNIIQHGMFPSGHVLLVFVAYYLSDKIVSKNGRILLILCCFVEVISLILSRGHYSIDIVGGFLLAYFVVNELKLRRQTLNLRLSNSVSN